jgi:hypothetical protein
MVAGRQEVGAGIVEFAGEALGQAEPGRGILGVDDRDVDREVALQPRQMRLDRIAPRAPDHIAADENVQQGASPSKATRITG